MASAAPTARKRTVRMRARVILVFMAPF